MRALLEPYQTIVRRNNEGRAPRRIGEERAAAAAYRLDAADVPRLRDAADLLLRAEQETSKRFLEVRTKLLDVARMVAIDGPALRTASPLTTQLDLELPDALMLASVIGVADERPPPSIFINRNTKDFDDPDVKARLRRVACDLVWKFDDGLARVNSVLAKNAAT